MLRRDISSGHGRRRGAGGQGDGLTEVIFEFIPVGHIVKVSAIDPATGTEVSIMGPATENHHALERVALAKLRFVMNGKSERNDC